MQLWSDTFMIKTKFYAGHYPTKTLLFSGLGTGYEEKMTLSTDTG